MSSSRTFKCKAKGVLASIDINVDVAINVELRECHTNKLLDLDFLKPFVFGDNSYAWFTVGHEDGGCDSYFCELSDIGREAWEEEITINGRSKRIENCIKDSLQLGYYWYFRRSAGQPSMVNLAYGVIAASLAQLTKGFIFTDDGAWEYKKFPTTPEGFLMWYFRPHLSNY